MTRGRDDTPGEVEVARSWAADDEQITRWDTGDLRLLHRGIVLASTASGRWTLQLPPHRGMDPTGPIERPASLNLPPEFAEIVWPITMGAPIVPIEIGRRADIESDRGVMTPGDDVAPPDAQALFDNAMAISADQLHRALPWILATDGDIRAIRQARVAVRRMRTILRGFRPMFVERPIELENDLQQLNSALRAARDLETIDRTSAGLGDAERGERLQRALGDERRLAVRDLHAELVHHRTGLLLNDLAEPPIVRLADDHQDPVLVARSVLRKAVRDARRQVDRVRSAQGGEQPDRDALVAEHLRLRTLVRRLRVLATATIPTLGNDAQRLARRASTVQQRLGSLADLQKTSRWLATGSADPVDDEERRRLATSAQPREDELLDGWAEAWDRVAGPGQLEWLEEAPLDEPASDPGGVQTDQPTS